MSAAELAGLRKAGGLFLGKTNTIESGCHCGSTDNHLFGPTHNPWRHGSIAGGSSGGAATGMGQLHEGSDGAGSVRSPSSLLGVVGLKPTGGRIPQSILPGRFNALMLNILAGPDSSDPTSLPIDATGYVACGLKEAPTDRRRRPADRGKLCRCWAQHCPAA